MTTSVSRRTKRRPTAVGCPSTREVRRLRLASDARTRQRPRRGHAGPAARGALARSRPARASARPRRQVRAPRRGRSRPGRSSDAIRDTGDVLDPACGGCAAARRAASTGGGRGRCLDDDLDRGAVGRDGCPSWWTTLRSWLPGSLDAAERGSHAESRAASESSTAPHASVQASGRRTTRPARRPRRSPAIPAWPGVAW